MTARELSLPRDSFAVVAGLAGLAVLGALSALWAPSVPLALLEVERTLVYAAAAAAAALVARRAPGALPAGVLAAAVVLACWNLALRVARAGDEIDLGNRGVLAEPIGYENALGALAAMGIVLALGLRGAAPLRAAAVVPLAAVVAASGNRGAWVALAAGVLVLVAFDPGTLRAPVTIACGVAAAAFAAWSPTLEPDVDPSRAADGAPWLAVGVLGLAAVAALAARERDATFDRSRRRVTLALAAAAALVAVGLVGAGGQRHTYWRAALDQAADARLLGDGAGSFARHWLATRTDALTVRDAHSLYLETLGEYGVAGLALVGVVLLVPLRAAARDAPAAAALAVFAAHAAYDWDWEMPAVALAALFCAVALASRSGRTVSLTTPWRFGAAGAALAVAALALPPFAGHAALSAADSSFRAGRYGEALDRADRAAALLPWSQEPPFLSATILLQRGAEESARAELERALLRDGSDARLWRALADVSAGPARRRALERAEELDPLGAPRR